MSEDCVEVKVWERMPVWTLLKKLVNYSFYIQVGCDVSNCIEISRSKFSKILLAKEGSLVLVCIGGVHGCILAGLFVLFAGNWIFFLSLLLSLVFQKVGNVGFSVSFLHFTNLVSYFSGQFYLVLVFDMQIERWETQIYFFAFAQVDLFCLLKSLIFVLGLEIFSFLSSQLDILIFHGDQGSC